MSERVEVRGIIASKQGLSCEGYYMLSNRTAHLRERLYVSVRDGDKLFLPQGNEHFPCAELEAFYVKRLRVGFFQSIGAGGGEVLFSCEGSSAQAAEEGAEAIAAALPEVDAAVNLSLLPRWGAAIPQKRGYLLTVKGASTPAYRPELLPDRPGPPQPLTEEQAKVYNPEELARKLASFEEKKREVLAGWGLLKDYDQVRATPAPSVQPRNPANPPMRDISQAINRRF